MAKIADEKHGFMVKLGSKLRYSKAGKWTTGALVGIGLTAGVGKLLDDTNSGPSKPEHVTQNVINQSNDSYDIDDATFNLDHNNPEIVLNTHGDVAINYEEEASKLYEKLKSVFPSSEDLDIGEIDAVNHLHELSEEDRSNIVRILAKDYRACEESIRMYGEITTDAVGENNLCQNYFNEDGEKTIMIDEIGNLATLVMTEEYAAVHGGFPKNDNQEQVYNQLGEDFSSKFKAYENLADNVDNLKSELLNSVIANVGDLPELSDILDKGDLSGEETYLIKEAKDRIVSAYNSSNDNYKYNNQHLDDVEYVSNNAINHNLSYIDTESYSDIEVVKEYLNNYEKNADIENSQNPKHESALDYAKEVRSAAEYFGVSDNLEIEFNSNTKEVSMHMSLNHDGSEKDEFER